MKFFITFSYYNRTNFHSLFSQTVIVKQVGGKLKILSLSNLIQLIIDTTLSKSKCGGLALYQCTIVLSFSGRRDNDIS